MGRRTADTDWRADEGNMKTEYDEKLGTTQKCAGAGGLVGTPPDPDPVHWVGVTTWCNNNCEMCAAQFYYSIIVGIKSVATIFKASLFSDPTKGRIHWKNKT